MKKKTRKRRRSIYQDDFDGLRIEDLKPYHDSRLPSPLELARALLNSKITIVLDNDIVDFFRKEAKKHDVGYQQMIRQVLRKYVEEMKRAACLAPDRVPTG